MSKNHKNYRPQTPTINNENVVQTENADVEVRVTPDEGVNSIDETNETEDVEITESVVEEVSVADTQESDISEQEDSSATLEEIEEEEEQPEEVTPVIQEEKIEQKVEVEEKVEEKPIICDPKTTPVIETGDVKGTNFYVSIGTVDASKMNVVKERLIKAGFTSASVIDDELVIGPFTTEVECIAARKAVVSKGLKGRIVEK